MLLIGESGIKSGDLMENVYNKLCGKKIPKKRIDKRFKLFISSTLGLNIKQRIRS